MLGIITKLTLVQLANSLLAGLLTLHVLGPKLLGLAHSCSLRLLFIIIGSSTCPLWSYPWTNLRALILLPRERQSSMAAVVSKVGRVLRVVSTLVDRCAVEESRWAPNKVIRSCSLPPSLTTPPTSHDRRRPWSPGERSVMP